MITLFKKQKKISFLTSNLEWSHHDKLNPYFVAFAVLLSPPFFDHLKPDDIQTLNFSPCS